MLNHHTPTPSSAHTRPTLAWVDRLHEVGSPILRRRDRVASLIGQAEELEMRAQQLRAEARAEQKGLMARVLENWTLADLERADPRSTSRHARALVLGVRDTRLMPALLEIEGTASPVDLLQVFGREVLRLPGQTWNDSEAAQRAMAERALDWWRLAVVPLLRQYGHELRAHGLPADDPTERPEEATPEPEALCPDCGASVAYTQWQPVEDEPHLAGCPNCHHATAVDELFPPLTTGKPLD